MALHISYVYTKIHSVRPITATLTPIILGLLKQNAAKKISAKREKITDIRCHNKICFNF